MGIEVIEKRITRDEVYCADEAFFTGTAAEVTPIRELDNRQIGVGHRGPITKALQENTLTSSTAAPLPMPTGWPPSNQEKIDVRQQSC
jgi:branched-subunit amino acid aminotransferase/4-amino-4-deoxychorismate lyase